MCKLRTVHYDGSVVLDEPVAHVVGLVRVKIRMREHPNALVRVVAVLPVVPVQVQLVLDNRREPLVRAVLVDTRPTTDELM